MAYDPTPTQFEEVRRILESAGVRHCWYSTETGGDEALFFIPQANYRWINERRLTSRLMDVLPDRKVWVTKFAADAPARQLF